MLPNLPRLTNQKDTRALPAAGVFPHWAAFSALSDARETAVKVLSWLLGLPVALLAIVFAVVNRHPVTVDIWPLPWDVSAPLYLLVLGALAIGVILGSILTWLAGVPVRGKATRESRRANVMAYQLDQLKVENEALQKDRQTALPPMES